MIMIALHAALVTFFAIQLVRLHRRGISWTDELYIKSLTVLAVVGNLVAVILSIITMWR